MSDATTSIPEPLDPATTSPYISGNSKQFHRAANRALDHYLKPAEPDEHQAPRKPSSVFVVAPDVNAEVLLAQACESLASASVMASDFAALLEGAQRNTMMALQQIIMLGELAVNRMLDNVETPSQAKADCSPVDA
ncbi:DUF6124 family protein [Pseudomonas sp. NFX71]|uniref:DUF6124 family protein n=1 Tax=Pseudomonas sp. NFX71 TaxID=3399121 RepID=UPI003A837F2C